MSTVSRSAAEEAREMFELKKKALQYYSDNGVPEKMEEILNSTFYDSPNDVYGHLANYFEGFQKAPTVTKVVSREALDGKGQSTVQTEVYCMVKNFEKLLCTSLSSNESYPPDSMKQEDKDLAEAERQKDITKSVELINSVFCTALTGSDPTHQEDTDVLILNTLEKLCEEAERLSKEKEDEEGPDGEGEIPSARSPVAQESKTKAPKSPKGKNKGPAVVIIPDEPRENYFCGCTAVSALSQTVACTGAGIKDIPLFQHIAGCRYDEAPEKLSLPIPMLTIMMSGKMAPGKLNCVKEFMIMPRPDMPYKESIKHIMSIYNHCAKSISAKTGIVGRAVNDQGALWATFDRPEQGLDLLQEAMTQAELTPGEHFNIAINCAAHEIFDYDKGKYEVIVGQQKAADDLVDFWSDIVNKYPSVIALIDPMRKQEKSAWMRLCESVSEKCYILGDVVYHRPGLLKHEEICADFRTSGLVLRMEHMNSLTDIISAAKKMEDADNQIVIGTGVGETTDTFPVDLAVGCGARFIKLGAPSRGERVSKLNRLLQVEALLEGAGRLQPLMEHTFPLIKPPTPPPEVTDEEGATDGDQATARSNDSKKT